jgi:hypothetical protein
MYIVFCDQDTASNLSVGSSPVESKTLIHEILNYNYFFTKKFRGRGVGTSVVKPLGFFSDSDSG